MYVAPGTLKAYTYFQPEA